MKMFKKITSKGVSPLIATILLVAVSLSLAGILYSWASNNAGDTVRNVTDTSKKWDYCSNVNISIEYGCKFYEGVGVSFILNDRSTVEFDTNLIINVIDKEGEYGIATIKPNFKGGIMKIDTKDYEDNELPISDLNSPIQLVRVHLQGCEDRVAQTRTCPLSD